MSISISTAAVSKFYNTSGNSCPLLSNRNVRVKRNMIIRRLCNTSSTDDTELYTVFHAMYLHHSAMGRINIFNIDTLAALSFLFRNPRLPQRFNDSAALKINELLPGRRAALWTEFNRYIACFDAEKIQGGGVCAAYLHFKSHCDSRHSPAEPVNNTPLIPLNAPRMLRQPADPIDAAVAALRAVQSAQIIAARQPPRVINIIAYKIPEHIKIHLRAAIVNTDKTCPVCITVFRGMNPDDVIVSNCGHYTCADCYAGILSHSPRPKCCECREKLSN
jgi:hypothetical protein